MGDDEVSSGDRARGLVAEIVSLFVDMESEVLDVDDQFPVGDGTLYNAQRQFIPSKFWRDLLGNLENF